MPNLVPLRRSVERETGFEPATPSLEGWRSTAELFPRSLSTRRSSPAKVVGRGRFEPQKAFASRFTVCPLWPTWVSPRLSSDCNPLKWLALAGGFEPPTHCLQGSCSTPELRQQSQNFTLDSRPHQVKAFLSRFFSRPPLTHHLVAEHRGCGRDVQRAQPSQHRQTHQEVTTLSD